MGIEIAAISADVSKHEVSGGCTESAGLTPALVVAVTSANESASPVDGSTSSTLAAEARSEKRNKQFLTVHSENQINK